MDYQIRNTNISGEWVKSYDSDTTFIASIAPSVRDAWGISDDELKALYAKVTGKVSIEPKGKEKK